MRASRSRSQRAESGQPADVPCSRALPGVARPAGRRRPRRPPDRRPLGERHRQRRLGHAVGREDRVGPQVERFAGVDQVFDVGGLHRLGARQRENAVTNRIHRASRRRNRWQTAHRRSWAPRSWCPYLSMSLAHSRCRAGSPAGTDQFRAEVHRDREKADHAHVVEAGQPLTMTSLSTPYSAPMNIALGVGVDAAVGDDHRFGDPVEPDVNCISATSSRRSRPGRSVRRSASPARSAPSRRALLEESARRPGTGRR